MELTGYFPRVIGIEKRVTASTKYSARLSRPAKPPLKIKTFEVKPYGAEPADQPGTLAIVVIATGREIPPDEAGAPARKKGPASRRTKQAAPRPRPRRETKAQEVARLERELVLLEAEDEGSEPG